MVRSTARPALLESTKCRRRSHNGSRSSTISTPTCWHLRRIQPAEQIPRWIAAEHQFRTQEHVGPCVTGCSHGGQHRITIGEDVADHGVELGQRNCRSVDCTPACWK